MINALSCAQADVAFDRAARERGTNLCGSDAKQKQSENCCDDWLGLVGDDHHKYACDQAVM